MSTDAKAPITLRLTGELTVRTIAEAHQKLISAYAKNRGLRIDTSNVSEADLTAVQLIEAARRSSLADGRRIALSPPPPNPIRELLDRGGFLGTGEGSSFWKGE